MIINQLISKNQMTVLANKIKNITFYKINQNNYAGLHISNFCFLLNCPVSTNFHVSSVSSRKNREKDRA